MISTTKLLTYSDKFFPHIKHEVKFRFQIILKFSIFANSISLLGVFYRLNLLNPKVLSLTKSFLYGPTSSTAVTLKTRRGEVPGSNPGRACRPSHMEFSVVFSETRANTG